MEKHNPLQVITKKPLVAADAEQKQNTRSRSAKLRVAEKK
ncbi:MAG: 16S rRNA (cytosine(1402)-N(4))-methyltransferase [Methylophilaceae bacterium]